MRNMRSVLSFGAVTAFAGLVIWARIRARQAKKAEKWEKGEIIKQLVALSDGENGVSARGDAKLCSKRKHSPVSASPVSKRSAAEIDEKIRQRAYELYQKRGGKGGNPTDDWLQAKREVLNQKT